MSISEDFQNLLENIKIDNTDTISLRYGEITGVLNREFRGTESKIANNLQIGSYGRSTAIKGISDLDMIYIMPKSKWDEYKGGNQYALLRDTKDAIKARYPMTTVRVDRLVVRVLYKDFHVEVQPAFEQDDGSFKYPDTSGGGSWKITKPREEIAEMSYLNSQKNGNLRRLCKMARAWKNKHGVAMGGLLVDTLAYNFLKSTEEYDNKSYIYYDYMCRDFFEYLSEEEDKAFYLALGSRQQVRVKKKFKSKAKKAYKLCLKAIAAAGQKTEYKKWRAVFGSAFPAPEILENTAFAHVFRDTEEFIEDRFPLDVRYDLQLNCKVTQSGFRPSFLLDLLSRRIVLLRHKKLHFFIESSTFPDGCEIYWKVLNRGDVAQRKDNIRGDIVSDKGKREKFEDTSFAGEHVVECYAVLRGVVVARDNVSVPISWNQEEAG